MDLQFFYKKLNSKYPNLSKTFQISKTVNRKQTVSIHHIFNIKKIIKKIIIAIDAGHGGQDPGAIGKNSIKEKDITLSIANKLANLLNKTKFFKAIMIRNGNYFIPISKRTKIANQKHANLLISIHTNSSKNRKAIGLSVWIPPNKKTHIHYEHYKFNKKLKNLHTLNKSKNNLYTSKKHDTSQFKSRSIDLKSTNFQNSEYNLAKTIIRELQHVIILNQKKPKYARFSILQSSNFPSILIETGFISNPLEAKCLNKKYYQTIIVKFIIIALKKHFCIFSKK